MRLINWVHKLLGRLIYVIFNELLYFLVNNSVRVRIQLIHDGQVLLVKEWLGDGGWRLPGGGLKKSESLQLAVKRELKEELNLDLNDFELLPAPDDRRCQKKFSSFTLKYVELKVDIRPVVKLRKSEIIEHGWFDKNSQQFKQAFSSCN